MKNYRKTALVFIIVVAAFVITAMATNASPSEKNGIYYENGNSYYYLNNEKQSGWFEYEGKNYYARISTKIIVDSDMVIGGKQYFMSDESGLLLANGFSESEDGTRCYVEGKLVIGWRHADGTPVRVDENGVYEQYSTNPQGLYYFLSTTGYMVTDDTYTLGGYKREFNADHTVKALNGLQIKGETCRYYVDGEMQLGWQEVDGNKYYFLVSTGNAATMWQQIGGKLYYFASPVSAVPFALKTSGTIGGIEYTYGDSGNIAVTGFMNTVCATTTLNNTSPYIHMMDGTTKYYVNGEVQYGWQFINDKCYYFYANGSSNGSGNMCVTSRTIGGVYYEFTAEGACTSENRPEPEKQGFTVTAEPDGHAHITVYKFQSDALSGINGILTNIMLSRDSDTGECLIDGNGQVNFLITVDEGYEIDTVTVTPGYKNLKTPIDNGVEGLYRITKITADLTVTVTTKPKSEEPVHGYDVIFETNEHIKVNVYNLQSDALLGINGIETDSAKSRDSDSGEELRNGDGQVNFLIIVEDGYVIDEIIVTEGYKNIKLPSDTGVLGLYRITKITADLTVTITVKQEETPAEDGKKTAAELMIGNEYAASMYSGAFEVWPSAANSLWCPLAFYQNCLVIDKSILDMTENVGTKDYDYKFEYYYRNKATDELFTGSFTAPLETIYNGGTWVIYRLQVSECVEGDMVEDFTVGSEYEFIVRYYYADSLLGYSVLNYTWTEQNNNEHLKYKTFWTRHDRSTGYSSGDQTLTQTDIDDPYGKTQSLDGIDRSGATAIASPGSGYSTIFRVKSSSEILFSPFITELRAAVSGTVIGTPIDGYTAKLGITVKDSSGNELYEYPSIILPIYESKGAYFDIFLQGEGVDCSFCPISGMVYDIYIEILTENNTCCLLYGTWSNITASSVLEGSEYYNPTPIPEDDSDHTIVYKSKDTLMGSIVGKSTQILKSGETTQYVQAVAKEGYTFVSWNDGNINPIRCDEVINDKTYIAVFAKTVVNGVANMYVSTDNGLPITSKAEYVTGSVRIDSTNPEYCLAAVTTRLRGRGNSSWGGNAAQTTYGSKNSYRLKLDDKASLFGFTPNKDWVLGANKFDALGLRTWSMWQFASYMGTIPYYTKGEFVNLYINGEYRGMYLVSELIESASGRVEVIDDPGVEDKGFLIEIDFRGDTDAGAQLGLDYFYIDGYTASEFVVKSDIESEADTAKFKEYVQSCHNAIMSGDRARIDAMVDIPSLIDMFIIEELSKDVDVGAASFYMQRNPGEKLFFTAPWDFDFGFGTYGPGVGYTGFVSSGTSGCPWYTALRGQTWFREEVKARMLELDVTVMPQLYADINAKAEEIYGAGTQNGEYWNLFSNHYHAYVSGQVSTDLGDYGEHLEFFLSWMKSRWAWLEANI